MMPFELEIVDRDKPPVEYTGRQILSGQAPEGFYMGTGDSWVVWLVENSVGLVVCLRTSDGYCSPYIPSAEVWGRNRFVPLNGTLKLKYTPKETQ